MEKTILVAIMVALIFVSVFCAVSFAALIHREEEQRDPATGYDPPPGESFSYAYQYGEYDPTTQKYYNIYSYHDYGWKTGTGTYEPHTYRSLDEYHPWIQTYVCHVRDGQKPIDTFVEIEW